MMHLKIGETAEILVPLAAATCIGNMMMAGSDMDSTIGNGTVHSTLLESEKDLALKRGHSMTRVHIITENMSVKCIGVTP